MRDFHHYFHFSRSLEVTCHNEFLYETLIILVKKTPFN